MSPFFTEHLGQNMNTLSHPTLCRGGSVRFKDWFGKQLGWSIEEDILYRIKPAGLWILRDGREEKTIGPLITPNLTIRINDEDVVTGVEMTF